MLYFRHKHKRVSCGILSKYSGYHTGREEMMIGTLATCRALISEYLILPCSFKPHPPKKKCFLSWVRTMCVSECPACVWRCTCVYISIWGPQKNLGYQSSGAVDLKKRGKKTRAPHWPGTYWLARKPQGLPDFQYPVLGQTYRQAWLFLSFFFKYRYWKMRSGLLSMLLSLNALLKIKNQNYSSLTFKKMY